MSTSVDPQPDYFVVWLHNHNLSSPESWKFLQMIVIVAAEKLPTFSLPVFDEWERDIYIYIERERGCVGCFFVAAQLTLFSLRLRRQKLRYAATFDQLRSDSYCMRLWWIGARTHDCPNTRVISIRSLSDAQTSQRLSHTLKPQTDLNSVLNQQSDY